MTRLRSRSSALALAAVALGCHHAHGVDNVAVPAPGIAIAVYDRGDGTSTAVVDDRRWLELKRGETSLVLDDVDPAAALPSLVIEATGIQIGTCRRDEIVDPATAKTRRLEENPLYVGLEDVDPVVGQGKRGFAPIVRCEVDGAPGRYLVRVLYVTAGLAYRAQHEVRMVAADHATLRSTYVLATPSWHRTAEVTVFDGVPGGDHPPAPLAHGQVLLDGSSGAIVVPEHEVKGRLRRVFDGAMLTAADVPSSDIAWGESSLEIVWVWLELADARVPPGPVHAIIDLPDELARVSDIPIEARRRQGDGAASRLPIYADEDLHGTRQRWHDVSDGAELADRFLMSVANTGEKAREVWVEEHLRTAKRRHVARAWPKPPGLHGEILRTKLVVRPGKVERIGYTVDYEF